jgi:hypothetical protein
MFPDRSGPGERWARRSGWCARAGWRTGPASRSPPSKRVRARPVRRRCCRGGCAVTFGGNWQGIFGAIWPVHRCRCLKSCAPMTEVGCTGHQHDWPEHLGGVSALHATPVKHVMAGASVSEKFARNQESMQGLVLLAHSSAFLCSASPRLSAAARRMAAAPAGGAGKAGFHGFRAGAYEDPVASRHPGRRGVGLLDLVGQLAVGLEVVVAAKPVVVRASGCGVVGGRTARAQ